jgi:2-polyprenyl-3-methyl-5-hydroxy-6-metoxy-1,4-benzoquinol methylase
MSLTESAVQASGGITADGGIVHGRVCQLLQQMPAQGKTVADIGAGIGEFTRTLLKQFNFQQVVSTDYMTCPPDLQQRCTWHQADLNQSLPIADQSIDIACAIEVIEHLENPRHFSRQLFRILKPGGTAIITTPNNLALRSKVSLVVRGYFFAFGAQDYPAHISPILQIDMERILQETGFTRVAHHYSNRGLIPGSGGQQWQTLFPFLKGIHFSDSLLTVATKD